MNPFCLLVSLNVQKSPLFSKALRVVKTLQNAGHTAYFAGGCVRDAALERTFSDIDIATNATPQEIMRLFSKHKAVGAHFGVIIVYIDKNTFEIATFREDGSYADGRRPTSVVFSTPQQDAKRRDFTINGLFYDPIAKTVHDFVGGVDDLHTKMIRTIGNPNDRFDEDKLRILRFFRFYGQLCPFGFQKDPVTLNSIKKIAPSLSAISRERIKEEWIKITKTQPLLEILKDFNTYGLCEPIFKLPLIKDRSLLLIKALVSDPLFNTFELSWLFVLLAITFDFDDPQTFSLNQVSKLFVLSNQEKLGLKNTLAVFYDFKTLLKEPMHKQKRFFRMSYIKESLFFVYSVILIYKPQNKDLYDQFTNLYDLYKDHLYPIIYVKGEDLIQKGLTPSPLFKDILNSIENHQLDETINTKQECFDFLEKILEEKKLSK